MEIEQFAAIFNAKKVSRGHWVAKCPAHSDRTPSMGIWAGNRSRGPQSIMFKCRSQGCHAESILRAVGLKWSDVLGDKPASQEIKSRLADEKRLDKLQQRYRDMLYLAHVEPEKRRYWEAAARRILQDLEPLYWKVMPDKERFDRIRAFELKCAHEKRLDWLLERGK